MARVRAREGPSRQRKLSEAVSILMQKLLKFFLAASEASFTPVGRFYCYLNCVFIYM